MATARAGRAAVASSVGAVDGPEAAAGVAHEVVGHVHAVPAGGLGVAGDLEHVGPRLGEARPDGEPHAAIASTTTSMQRVSAATSSGSMAGKRATRSWLRPSLR